MLASPTSQKCRTLALPDSIITHTETVELTQRVGAASSAHGGQVIWGKQHLEEALEGLALDEGVQASSVQAQSTEHIGEGAQHLAGSRNLQRETLCERTGRKRGGKREKKRGRERGRETAAREGLTAREEM